MGPTTSTGPRLLRSSEAFQGLAQATHQNGRMLVLRQTGRTVEQHHGQVFDDILLYIYIYIYSIHMY